MNDIERIKQCFKTLIDKIESDFDFSICLSNYVGLNNEYLKGKSCGIGDVLDDMQELYIFLFGDDD